MFGQLDPFVKGFGSVTVQDRNRLLGDDRARIHPSIDKVDGAACHFYSMFERLLPGFQTGEGWQQRGVDVDYAPLERAQKVAFEDPHKTSQRDQIHLRISQSQDEFPLRVIIELGPKFAGRNKASWQIPLSRVAEDSGRFHITRDQRDLDRETAYGKSLRQSDQI